MASTTEQTIKHESTIPSPSSSEQKSTTNTTIKPELSAIIKPEDETFEQFYSEVIYF